MPVNGNIFIVETGLLMKQLMPLLSEAKTLSFSAKAIQLIKRRRQRQARKGLTRKSLRRSFKIARKSINKRKMTMIKATRKRNRTRRVFKTFKPRKHK